MITPIDSTSTTGSGLNITEEAASYLKETGGWAKFLAILGFVFLGLIVLVALFMGTVLSTMGMSGQMGAMQTLLAVVYICMAALYFFPILYLFRFATKAQEAVKSNDTQTLTTALSNLKSHYKFIGILAAIVMGFYALAIVIALVAGGASMF